MSRKISVSVIIPVYNADKYLKKCLDSLISQTLNKIEIICIDDGSTDQSWKIIEEYTRQDSRVTGIQQKNSGAAAARNKGLEKAKGEYIGFLDSDDYVDSDYFAALYKTAKKQNADIARAYVKVDPSGGDLISQRFTTLNGHSAYEDQYNINIKNLISENKLNQRYVIWLAIYSRKMINDNSINFSPKILTGQDVLFNLKAGYCANKIVYVNSPVFYHRVMREGSLMTQFVRTASGIRSRLLVLNESVEFLNSKPDYEKSVYVSHVVDAINFIRDRIDAIEDNQVAQEVAKAIYSTWEKVKYKKEIQLSLKYTDEIFSKIINHDKKLLEYIYDMSSINTEERKVSVIIPVFNQQKYLKECIDSVINQSLRRIEIICVDDGSVDDSIRILEEYKTRDRRVKVLRQKNKGAGAARNKGLEISKGKYLYFLDSDDFIDRDLLKRVVFDIESQGADIAIFRAKENNVQTKVIKDIDWVFRDNLIPTKSIFSYEDMPAYIFNTFANVPWNKLFLKEFVVSNNITFQEVMRTNDLLFVCKALVLAKKLTIVKSPALISYRVGHGENSQATNDRQPLAFYDAFMALKNFLIERKIFEGDIKSSYINHALEGLIHNLESQRTYSGFKKVYNIILHENDLFKEDEITDKLIYDIAAYKNAYSKYLKIRTILEGEYLFERINNAKITIEEIQEKNRIKAETRKATISTLKIELEAVRSELNNLQQSRAWRVAKKAHHIKSFIDELKHQR